MSYFVCLLELWCVLLICLILGRRVTALLPNKMRQTIGFYISPLLGLAFLVLLSTLYGWLSPFKTSISMSVTAILVILAILFEPKKQELVWHGLYSALFALVCSLPLLAPIIHYGGYNPFTDIFTYIAQAQWLQQHSFTDKVITSGHYPAFTQMALYQATGSRMGGTFFLSYVQSLFALTWSYDAYMPTVSLGFVNGCLAIGAIIRQVVPIKRMVVLALALLPSLLMNGFVYGAEWGFFPQTFGLAFATGVAALFPLLIIEIMKMQAIEPSAVSFRLNLITRLLPLAICTAALLFAYNEPFPIFVIAIALFMAVILLMLFYASSRAKSGIFFSNTVAMSLKTVGLSLVVYLLEVVILINYEVIRIIKNIYQTLGVSSGGAAIGWPVLWSPIQFIASGFGLKSYFNRPGFSFDFFISSILFPLILIGLFYILVQFMRTHPKRRVTLIFVFCCEVVLLLFFCKFRYFSPNQSMVEVGHTFLQFKIAKYSAPFSMALLGTAGGLVWYYSRRYRLWLTRVYLVVVVFGLIYHVNIVARNFTNHFLSSVQQQQDPFDVLLKLREAVLAHVSDNQVIHVALGTEQSKLRQMVAYILQDKKLSSDYRDDGYIVGRLPPEDANMPAEQADYLILMKQLHDRADGNGLVIGPFILQSKPFHFVLAEKPVGGYNTEGDSGGNTWNWVPESIDFSYHIVGHPKAIRFSFLLRSHCQPGTIQIQLKTDAGKILAAYTLPSLAKEERVVSSWISTDAELVRLHVNADGKPARLSVADNRAAAFMIMNTALEANW